MAILEVRDVCKTYTQNKKSNNVLRNVNFHADEGEFVAIMGPSGSGKSTLLYSVSGMDRVTSGEVFIDGKLISNLQEKEMASIRLKKMGFIFQQMHMLRNLCVYDNVILSALSAKLQPRNEIYAQADALFRKFNILEISKHMIHEVSGGELQRACIARALINHPNIIFADEPAGALNSKAAKDVMDALKTVHEEGTTILMVTHDFAIAAKAQRVLYILDGGICDEIRLDEHASAKQREETLYQWLMKMGW